MKRIDRSRRGWAGWAVLALCVLLGGCLPVRRELVCDPEMPRETSKVNMPDYVIEPPDILLINAVRVIPLPPYHIEPLDTLFLQVKGVLEDKPISGLYVVEPDGTVNLGLDYGAVPVVGLTIPEAKQAVEAFLKKRFTKPEAVVALAQGRGGQQISGEHLVRPDGTVGLGIYGSVRVSGMTLAEAKAAIETHLGQFLQRPQIALDVLAYNSKVFYVIFDGGGSGQQIVRLPITGNETVLDAISQVNGLTPVSSEHHIWVARPGASDCADDQILPVDWKAVTCRGRTETNYQLLPGDRIYVQAQTLIRTDTILARVFSPMERIFGITLLGRGTVGALAQPLRGNGSGTGTTGLGGF
jgi:polysaccharide biosynthesis/export protein